MFKHFKRKKQDITTDSLVLNENKMVIKPKNMIATIKVADVKQYLVDEFERVQELEMELTEKNIEVDRLKEIQLEYNAGLVILDEFKNRVDILREKQKESLNKIDEINELRRLDNDRYNDLKITFKQLERNYDELYEQHENDNETIEKKVEDIIDERIDIQLIIVHNLLRFKIQEHKGNLSKQQALDYLQEIIEKEREKYE